MRVLAFSRTFPAYHPRAGQGTSFVEKIWFGLAEQGIISWTKLCELSRETGIGNYEIDTVRQTEIEPKHHTIRANRKDGKKWKVGDVFSPRVWSGKPYYSKQIIIAPPIEVKQAWDFSFNEIGEIYLDNVCVYGGPAFQGSTMEDIAKNDGLSMHDILEWFKYFKFQPKEYQIICWNPDVRY